MTMLKAITLSSSSATKSVNVRPTSAPTHSPQHNLRERRKMLRFVEAELVAAGEFEHRYQPSTAVGDRCRFDSLCLELLYRRGDVIAGQPQFVFGVVFCLMDGEFRRGCGEVPQLTKKPFALAPCSVDLWD
jgi:hypothetical protein